MDLGRAIYNAEAHTGVGGAGTGACSGDLLLGALAACAQITCQMVAASMGIPTQGIGVTVEGDLDLQGTLGISKEAPIGFESIRVIFDIQAPQATPEQLTALETKTEQYCVVMQTLQHPPRIENKWKH
ncbi:MAG TPA: OsmC family protein [Candidatus Acidoferrales bacterium]|nr:OsmC family protein [Candidatus Acidoferrales bacterium]